MNKRIDAIQIIYWSLISIVLVAVTAFNLSCQPGTFINPQSEIYRNLDQIGIGRHLAEFKHSTTTPGGVKVQSTVPVPTSALVEIDKGIQRTITQHSAVYPTWTKAKTLPEWKVLFIEPMATNTINEPGSPAIKVRGIQSCGTGIGIGYKEAVERETQYLVLPHQAATNWRYTSYLNACSENESAHLIEFENDWEIFIRWNYNDIHPRPFHLCGTDPNKYPC